MFESGSVNNLKSKKWTRSETRRRRTYFLHENAVFRWLLLRHGLLKGTVLARAVDERRAGQLSKMSFQWQWSAGGVFREVEQPPSWPGKPTVKSCVCNREIRGVAPWCLVLICMMIGLCTVCVWWINKNPIKSLCKCLALFYFDESWAEGDGPRHSWLGQFHTWIIAFREDLITCKSFMLWLNGGVCVDKKTHLEAIEKHSFKVMATYQSLI